jgi:hypothetical protein
VVATINTVVYSYKNTVRTSLTTTGNNVTLPTTTFGRDDFTMSGVPTDFVEGGGPYDGVQTFLVTGTVYTNPYGNKFTSPTPAFAVGEVRM